MDDAIGAFLEYLAVERGASPHTVRGYAGDLREFSAFLRRAGDLGPAAIDTRSVRAYLASLHQRGLAKSSIGRKLASVRSCLRFLARRGVIEQNPARLVRSPRPPRRLPSFLPKDESKQLLDRAPGPSASGRRDHALLELLYATGIRVAECCGLDGTDVDKSHGTVRVLGKGDKERVVPVGEVALEAIDAYLAVAGPPRRAALHQRSRGTAHDAQRAAHRRQGGAPQRDEPPGDAAYAPPHVRHPHAGRRGGPAPHPGASRAPAALHHPALHAREPRASHEGVRRRPPPRDLTDAMTGEGGGFHATTVACVRHRGQVALAGDGQVSIGQTIVKAGARKVRKVYHDRVLAGFAGAAADAFTLFAKFEAKLEEHRGNLPRAAVELAKDWRMDRVLRRLEALLAVADAQSSFIISGTGDVIEPDDGLIGIGSGGPFALAAARALCAHSALDAAADRRGGAAHRRRDLRLHQ